MKKYRLTKEDFKLLDRVIRYYKFDYYMVACETPKGKLLLYDFEERKTIRNNNDKLAHNELAIDILLNEYIVDCEWEKELLELRNRIMVSK